MCLHNVFPCSPFCFFTLYAAIAPGRRTSAFLRKSRHRDSITMLLPGVAEVAGEAPRFRAHGCRRDALNKLANPPHSQTSRFTSIDAMISTHVPRVELKSRL